MAKHAKRRKKATHRRSRRRIGAMALSPSSPLVKFGSMAAGFLLGDKINEALDKVVPATIDDKIVAAAELGIGYMLALKKGGRASLPKTVAGGLLLGAGAKKLMSSLGIGSIGGYQMVPTVGGYQGVPALGNKAIKGYVPGPGALNGYATTKQQIGGHGLVKEGGSLMN